MLGESRFIRKMPESGDWMTIRANTVSHREKVKKQFTSSSYIVYEYLKPRFSAQWPATEKRKTKIPPIKNNRQIQSAKSFFFFASLNFHDKYQQYKAPPLVSQHEQLSHLLNEVFHLGTIFD